MLEEVAGSEKAYLRALATLSWKQYWWYIYLKYVLYHSQTTMNAAVAQRITVTHTVTVSTHKVPSNVSANLDSLVTVSYAKVRSV